MVHRLDCIDQTEPVEVGKSESVFIKEHASKIILGRPGGEVTEFHIVAGVSATVADKIAIDSEGDGCAVLKRARRKRQGD